MKDDCPYCKLVKEKQNDALYEDDKIIAFLADKPAAKGHVVLMPKEHYPIIELVPDYIVSHLFSVANKVSSVIFDVLSAQGTNILVNNGIAAGQEIAHFAVNIVPRFESDGFDLVWKPKQLDETEMSTVELSLKEESQNIGAFEQESKEPIKVDDSEKVVEKEMDKENYLMKQLDKIP